MISKSWVISAVLPRMMLAEQYFSADSLMARSTISGFRPRPRTVKCMWIFVNTLGWSPARSAETSTSQPVTS
jgi:hypothetical protein